MDSSLHSKIGLTVVVFSMIDSALFLAVTEEPTLHAASSRAAIIEAVARVGAYCVPKSSDDRSSGRIRTILWKARRGIQHGFVNSLGASI